MEKEIISKIPAWKVALRKAMREVELEEAYDREVKTRVVRHKAYHEAAKRRRAQAYARKAEAQAVLAAANAEYRNYLRQQARIKMARAQDQQEALDHGVVIDNPEPPDIVRDIQWVYDHIGDLFSVNDRGAKIFNNDILKQAPSNGAVAMANYALTDQKAFFDRFVIKLVPRDAGTTEEDKIQSEDDLVAKLDPSFEDMKDFFK